MKYAALSMDVEDWYHTGYLDKSKCDRSVSMLDGIEVFARILEDEGVRGTFFVLGEIVEELREKLVELDRRGHEVGSHGWGHVRPVEIPEADFQAEVLRCREQLEGVLGHPVAGFRAACFGIDRSRIDVLKGAGFEYDTSFNPYENNSQYGKVDLTGFEEVGDGVHRSDSFFEYALCKQKTFFGNFPVSGGGYFRMFPWWFVGPKISRFLSEHSFYGFYIHPMELSEAGAPPFPPEVNPIQKARFLTGRRSVAGKLRRLIAELRAQDYEITTYSALRSKLLSDADAA